MSDDDNQGTATGDERHEETEGTATEQDRDDVGEGTETTGADEGKPEEASSDAGPADEDEQIKQEMKQVEEDPPENLEDWPQGKAKYETMGGPEGDHGYHEGPEQNLGPSALRHHEGGEVTIEGEKVDNPDEYKGEPIPGGPTDPNSPDAAGEREKEESGDDDQQADGEDETQ